MKNARYFAGIRVDGADAENAFLRVTSYHPEQSIDAGDHVRFSVWVGDTARCVISIPASEARELIAFLGAELRVAQPA